MIRLVKGILALVALVMVSTQPVLAAEHVDLLLVLSSDVSRSVDHPKFLLQREGCRVERAATGEDAVSIAMARQFDVIFMDLGLPGLDGIGATKALRAKGLTTPIIALTANAYEEDRRACLNAGMNDFLSKPIEIVALKSKLQMWASAQASTTAKAG